MPHHWKLLAATHFAAGLTGWVIAPREMLEEVTVNEGLFQTETRRVLAATVESLRAESKMTVYTYKGSASVSVERTKLWLLSGRQDLIVPALVQFQIDLSQLGMEDVAYDNRTRVLKVILPPLELSDVAFQPEAARSINDGILTYDQDQVDELARANWLTARRAFIKQAQGATLLAAAKAEAERSITGAFAVPLRALGRPDVKIEASFEPT